MGWPLIISLNRCEHKVKHSGTNTVMLFSYTHIQYSFIGTIFLQRDKNINIQYSCCNNTIWIRMVSTYPEYGYIGYEFRVVKLGNAVMLKYYIIFYHYIRGGSNVILCTIGNSTILDSTVASDTIVDNTITRQ